jgi:putative oxidoreductase
MLASIFVVQGLDTFQHPEREAKAAAPVVGPIAERIPAIPADPEQAVRLNGAIQAVAGTTLGLGVLPRLSALVLAGTLVPTTLAGHRYWEIEDPELRAQQRIHFLKNLTMLGGLLVAVADTGGSPSLAWRRKKASRAANRHLAEMQQAISGQVNVAGDRIATAGSATADQLTALTGVLSETAQAAGGYLAELKQALAESARAIADRLPDTERAVEDSVRRATHVATEASADLAGFVADRARHASDAAFSTGRQAADTAITAGRQAADTAITAGRQAADTAVTAGRQAADTAITAGRQAAHAR